MINEIREGKKLCIYIYKKKKDVLQVKNYGKLENQQRKQ